LLNAVTFGVAALAVLAIPAGQTFRPSRPDGDTEGLLHGIAAGAAVLRSCPAALRLVGADIMCSTIYGTQTVLLLLVSRSLGMGAHGYGYLFAGIGAGALAGTVLAGRVQRWGHPRLVLPAALCAVGLPMPLLAVAAWPAAAIVLVAATGAGAVLVEILTDTGLQRMLDEDVFGRAYGLALPASLAGIVVGSLVAPLLAGALGETGALVAVGLAVLAYALFLLRQGPAQRGLVTAQAEPATESEPASVLVAQP
jgi:predicted MFS family arabinose efflux permease